MKNWAEAHSTAAEIWQNTSFSSSIGVYNSNAAQQNHQSGTQHFHTDYELKLSSGVPDQCTKPFKLSLLRAGISKTMFSSTSVVVT